MFGSRKTRNHDGTPETAIERRFYDGRERGDTRPFNWSTGRFLTVEDPEMETFRALARDRGEEVNW